MSIQRFGRRMFLRSASGFALAIPTLHSLLPRAMAASPAQKRFVTLAAEVGRKWDWWYPGAPFTPTLQQVNGYIEKPLSGISGNISQILGAEFNPFRSKLTMIRGLDGLWGDSNADVNHRSAVILAGTPFLSADKKWKQGPSIDQILAASSKIYASTPKARVMNLGQFFPLSFTYNKDAGDVRMKAAATENNPTVVFDKYFKGLMPSQQSQGPTPDENRRKLVVDFALDSYKSARTNTKMSRSEVVILDEHLESLFEIEKRFAQTSTPTVTCTVPTIKGGTYTLPVNRDQWTEDFLTLLATAIKCGMTNIGNVSLTEAENYYVYNFIPGVKGDGLHTLSHWSSTENDDSNLKVNQWVAKKVASFLARLDTLEDSTTGATFLDNSLVMYTDDHTDTNLHHHADRPCLLAGGLGGKVRTGLYIDYRTQIQHKFQHANNTWRFGRDWNQLLVTILQAFGLTESEYYQPSMLHANDQVSPGVGSDQLLAKGVDVYNKRDRRNALPGVLKG